MAVLTTSPKIYILPPFVSMSRASLEEEDEGDGVVSITAISCANPVFVPGDTYLVTIRINLRATQ